MRLWGLLFFVFYCTATLTAHAASCLDQGLLGFIQDKNSTEYLEQVFPLCVHQRQCSPAIDALEKLKNIDMVKYSFLKGAALANGDCFKKNINEAEKLLSYCAKYSKICRQNLFNLYNLYASDRNNYIDFATELALEGNPNAISYLIELNLSKHNISGYRISYFWSKLLCNLLQHKLHNTQNWYNNLEPSVRIQLEKNEIADINNIKTFLNSVMSSLKLIESNISRDDIARINLLIIPFEKNILANSSRPDELANIGLIYTVSGKTQAQAKATKKVKANPPQLNISKMLDEYVKVLEEIRS